MCRNAENPCPGCTKHREPDRVWMFFTDEERASLERRGTPARNRAAANAGSGPAIDTATRATPGLPSTEMIS